MNMTKSKSNMRINNNQPFPCRHVAPENPAYYHLTLGEARPKLATARFDPQSGTLYPEKGKAIADYFIKLGFSHYAPLDKTVFNKAPSGWCSWYIYWRQINAAEFLRVAEWLGKNLAPYGMEYCQLDDAWQGHGAKDSPFFRDWQTLDKNFAAPAKGGMKAVADKIRSCGLKPGIWLIPQTQSNDALVRENPDIWLLDKSGKPVGSSWAGKYFLDPTHPGALKYLQELSRVLVKDWGYEYLKIDGQPRTFELYSQAQEHFRDSSFPFKDAYRQTLEAVRKGAGRKTFLVGCAGRVDEIMGVFHGNRTAGDDGPSWAQMMPFLRALLSGLPVNGIGWYSDPDVVMVRPTFTAGQARFFATLASLSGEAFLNSDKVYDLPEARVEILRRTCATLPIRPFDLYMPQFSQFKGLAVHVSRTGGDNIVVAAANRREREAETHHITWESLGIKAGGRCHVFDFWNKTYLGCWEQGVFIDVPPMDVRVFSVQPESAKPQVLSTSRHVIQGALELSEVKYDSMTKTLSGKSKVVANDDYEIRFAVPLAAKKRWVIKQARAGKLPVKIGSNNGCPVIRFSSPESKTVSWNVIFEIVAKEAMPQISSTGLPSVSFSKPGSASVRFATGEWNNIPACRIFVDGKLEGVAFQSPVELDGIVSDRKYAFATQNVNLDGEPMELECKNEIRVHVPASDVIYLSDLVAVTEKRTNSRVFHGITASNLSVNNRIMCLSGETFEHGIGVGACSEMTYAVPVGMSRFKSVIGVDDHSLTKEGEVTFSILLDGKGTCVGGKLKYGVNPIHVDLPLKSAKKLTLVTAYHGETLANMQHMAVDWSEARFEKFDICRATRY
jgi:hypothetical protein